MKSIDRILSIAVVFIGLGIGLVFRHFDHPAEATVYNVTAPGSVGVFDHLSVRGTNGLPSADFEGTVMTSLNAGEITLSGVTRSTWPSGTSPNTTKGDIYGFSTLDARLPVGLNRQILQADSTQSLGLGYTSDIHTSTATFAASTHTSLTMVGAVNPSGQNATAGFVGVSVASLTASDTVTFKGTIHDSLGGGGTVGKVLTMGSDNLTPYWATAAGGGLASSKATSVQTAKTITSTDPTDAANDLATVTITPTSASNNVLVVATGTINVTATDRSCAFSLIRDTTMISQMTHGAYAQFETAYANAAANIKLDSPATTSAVTYRVRGYINVAGGSCIYMTNSTNNLTIYVEEKSP